MKHPGRCGLQLWGAPLLSAMARIRTVKPELFQHSDLYDAEEDTKLPLRLSFIALFTCCDREGRFRWKPRELKVACLPYDNCDFSRVLDALTTRGFVVRYASNDGSEYGCIPSFTRHQVINNREAPSSYPSPTEPGTVTRDPRVEDACPTPAKGKGREQEGKGREQEQEGEGRVEHASVKVHDAVLWPSFDDFWTLYEKKGSRKLTEAEWRKISQRDREAIMHRVPDYNRAKPDKVYRKDGQRFLRDRTWEDEIITSNHRTNGSESIADKTAGVLEILRAGRL